MFTQLENFNPNYVAAAFITLAQDGTTAKDDNGKFFEFIRENKHLFPGLDTDDTSAMEHANSLCEEVWAMNAPEIADNYAALLCAQIRAMNTKTVAAFTVGKDGPTSAIITEAGTAPKDGLRGFLKRHPKALRFTSCEAATSAFYKIKEEL